MSLDQQSDPCPNLQLIPRSLQAGKLVQGRARMRKGEKEVDRSYRSVWPIRKDDTRQNLVEDLQEENESEARARDI